MKVDLLPHNQEAYEKVKNILQTNSKTCIIQPTGSGKSFLILKLIEDYVEDERDIIVIEPQKYIFGQLQKKMKKYGLSNEHVKFLTYSALGKIDEEKLQKYNSPVMVVVDEMHRAGAKTWKSGLQKMFSSFPNDCKYIGFSATPIRFLDGKRNMAEELFDGCIANEIGLADAILNRILPLPRYIAGLYTYDNEVNAITKKIRQSYNSEKEKKELLEEVSVMKKNLDKSKGISSIFKKYINSDKGKYVAFFRNVSHLQEMKPCLEKWFSEAGLDVNLYEVHCKLPKKDKQFNAFMENDRLSVCLSVAMLSEGVHGIDGVILLRDLISPNLYYQQIGRAFSVDMDRVPIIFDLVANCESIMDCSLKSDLLEAIDQRDSEKENNCDIEENKTEITKKDIEDFFVFDQVIDAVNAFRSIEGRLEGNEWTEEEIEILKKYYPIEGSNVVNRLNNRSKSAIFTITSKLGIKAPEKKWTKEDEDILRLYYPQYGGKTINFLPHRPISSITDRANSLGLYVEKRGIYSKEEDEIIKKYYPTEGGKVCKRLQGKTEKQCKGRAGVLGVIFINSKMWTNEEDEIIKNNYIENPEIVHEKLKNKSKEQIMRRASKLKIRRKTLDWTEEEDEIMKKYYPVEKSFVFKRLEKRSRNACMNRAMVLGLTSNKKVWTEEEINILKEYYPIMGSKVCQMINRDEGSCHTKASKLGIKYNRKNTKYVYKNGNNYEVHFVLKGEMLRFGNFKNKEEAIRVAMEKAKEYGKEI
jgi:DNA or RNA helicases of superfamily II